MSSEPPAALVDVVDLVKDYQALRPLRIKALRVASDDAVALTGIDRTGAEVLVNLLTGASLPDRGTVTVFGRPTTAITTSDAWLETLRRFALMSDRTVVVDQLTVEENLALAHTLTLDAPADDMRALVRRLAQEVGLTSALLAARADGLAPLEVARVRLGRAIALGADVLLAEHPTAALSERRDREALAETLAAVVRTRRMAAVYVTADLDFVRQAGAELLTLTPATGALTASGGWRRWFR